MGSGKLAAQADAKKLSGDLARRRTLFLAAAAGLVFLQTVFFAVWIWRESAGQGMDIRVAVVPVDPRDLLRGQYLQLSYAFESPGSFPAGDYPGVGAAVYAVLRRNRETNLFEPFACADSVAALKIRVREMLREEGGFFEDYDDMRESREAVMIGGTVARSRFDFGGNHLFVPEGTEEPPMSGAVARLFVSDGMKLRVEGLEIGGRPWEPRPFAMPSR